jgi:hypothetical protein
VGQVRIRAIGCERMSKVKASLDGETILTGTRSNSNYAFWSRVEVDETYDLDALLRRLHEIRQTHGIHSEAWAHSRTVNLAPAFKIEPIDVLL